MHARYFSPYLGRFLRVDPVGGEVGSSQSWNRYTNVRNNPLGLLDPDGLAARIFIDNRSTGVTATTFSSSAVADRVRADFARAGADAVVSEGAPSVITWVGALVGRDTVHHVRIVDSPPSQRDRRGLMGVSEEGTNKTEVYATRAPLDNPNTPDQEREVSMANTVSHEVGHDLGLENSQNSPMDLMTSNVPVPEPEPDLDFSDRDAAALRQETQ
jgi:hypothetical protein